MDSAKDAEVDRFVSDLGQAISKDMAEIRQTELDLSGNFEDVRLYFTRDMGNGLEDDAKVFVDRLRRLVVPNDPQWEELYAVSFGSEKNILKHQVVRKELRYSGEIPSSMVIYLDATEVSHATAD